MTDPMAPTGLVIKQPWTFAFYQESVWRFKEEHGGEDPAYVIVPRGSRIIIEREFEDMLFPRGADEPAPLAPVIDELAGGDLVFIGIMAGIPVFEVRPVPPAYDSTKPH